MIPEVTVTITVPTDRLADLQAFCQEIPLAIRAIGEAGVPAPRASTTSIDELDGGEGLPMTPEKPKRKRRTKAEIAADKAKAEAEANKEPDPPQGDVEAVAAAAAAEAADDEVEPPSVDDVRAAITKAAEAGKAEDVRALIKELGVPDVSSIPADKRAYVIEALS